jgi:hypothetical protein
VSSQPQENQHESDTQPPLPLLMESAVSVCDSAPSYVPEAEIRKVFQQIQRTTSVGKIATGIRFLFTYEEIGAVRPEALLQMQIDEVFALLDREREKRTRWRCLSLFIGRQLVLTLPLFGFLMHLHWSIWLGYPMLIPLSLLFSSKAASQRHQAATATLARFDDVRAVGPLAEALEFQDKHVRPYAVQSLIRLLPRLKASNASLLNVQQRACLNRALNGENTELTLAILKAWEQVGDVAAITVVDRLAKNQRRGRQMPEVIVAAQECLRFLRQSTERRQSDSELLRPAGADQTSSDVLLRPVGPHSSAESANQLLRPSDDSG